MKKNNILTKVLSGFIISGFIFGITLAKSLESGEEIIEQLENEGWTDNEIKQALANLGYDISDYFDTSEIYTSRSCKVYNIEYTESLEAYISPDFEYKEYFINIDYLKRYIDSKNPQQSGCPTNKGRIKNFHNDTSSDTDRYIAPNGKIYFITQKNGQYTSNELREPRNFSSITELKNYIRDRNSLISMSIGETNSWNINQNLSHGSAEDLSNQSDNTINIENLNYDTDNTKDSNQYKENPIINEIDNSEDAKHQRDIKRINDLSQLQTAIVTARSENDELPGTSGNNIDATQGITIRGIVKDLKKAGRTNIPFDPLDRNTVNGLGNAEGVGEYIYLITKNNGKENAGFMLMMKPETESGANRIVCNGGEHNLDNGYITNSNDTKDIQYCETFVKSNTCGIDKERTYFKKCYYSDDSQLRYVLTY